MKKTFSNIKLLLRVYIAILLAFALFSTAYADRYSHRATPIDSMHRQTNDPVPIQAPTAADPAPTSNAAVGLMPSNAPAAQIDDCTECLRVYDACVKSDKDKNVCKKELETCDRHKCFFAGYPSTCQQAHDACQKGNKDACKTRDSCMWGFCGAMTKGIEEGKQCHYYVPQYKIHGCGYGSIFEIYKQCKKLPDNAQ